VVFIVVFINLDAKFHIAGEILETD